MSKGVPTTACSTWVNSLPLKTLLPLNSNPLTTGGWGVVVLGAAALADAGAVGNAVAVSAGAAGAAGSGVGAGAAKRTQLMVLSPLPRELGMAGLTGLGGN